MFLSWSNPSFPTFPDVFFSRIPYALGSVFYDKAPARFLFKKNPNRTIARPIPNETPTNYTFSNGAIYWSRPNNRLAAASYRHHKNDRKSSKCQGGGYVRSLHEFVFDVLLALSCCCVVVYFEFPRLFVFVLFPFVCFRLVLPLFPFLYSILLETL